jgi:hypothetical protein
MNDDVKKKSMKNMAMQSKSSDIKIRDRKFKDHVHFVRIVSLLKIAFTKKKSPRSRQP